MFSTNNALGVLYIRTLLSALKMEAAPSSEMLVRIYCSTWYHFQDVGNVGSHRR